MLRTFSLFAVALAVALTWFAEAQAFRCFAGRSSGSSDRGGIFSRLRQTRPASGDCSNGQCQLPAVGPPQATQVEPKRMPQPKGEPPAAK